MLHAMIADPNASVRRTVTSALRGVDADVREVADGRRLVASVEKASPGLLLVDYDILRALGPTAFGELRAKFPNMTVLMLLDADRPGAELGEMLTVGTTDFLAKPFDGVQLRHRVRVLNALQAATAPAAATVAAAERSRSAEAILATLHDPRSGRLHAGRVAEFMGLPLRALATALGRAYGGVHKTPHAESLQAGLGELRRLVELLLDVVGTRKAALAWLNTPSSDLAGETPMAVIRVGHAADVRALLESVVAGLPS